MTTAVEKIIEQVQTISPEETEQLINEVIQRETKNLDFATSERETLLIKNRIADAMLMRLKLRKEMNTGTLKWIQAEIQASRKRRGLE
jgi:hypothetical protein